MITDPYRSFLRKFREMFRHTENIFLLLAVPAIIMFIHITPHSWGLDEQVHTARVYQIADGGLYPDKTNNGYGGVLPSSLVSVVSGGWFESNSVDRELPVYDQKRQDIKNQDTLRELGSQPINSEKRQFYEFGTTGPYAPLVYLPAAIGMKIGMILNLSVDSTLVLSKLTQAVFYLVCVYAALRLMRDFKYKWVLFLIALLPMSIFLTTTINADTYTNAIAVLFIAVILKLLHSKVRLKSKQEISLYIISVLLMLTKPSYAIAIILIFLLPKTLFASKRQMYVKKILLFSVCMLIFGLFSLKGIQYGDSMAVYFTPEQMANISMMKQLTFIVTHPIDFLRVLMNTAWEYGREWHNGFIGKLGYNTVSTPYLVAQIATLAVVIAALYTDRIKKTQAYALLGVGLISAISVVGLLYLTFNEVGFGLATGVQGRYFIPCAILALAGFSSVIGVKTVMTNKTATILFSSLAFLVLYISLYVYSEALF